MAVKTRSGPEWWKIVGYHHCCDTLWNLIHDVLYDCDHELCIAYRDYEYVERYVER